MSDDIPRLARDDKHPLMEWFVAKARTSGKFDQITVAVWLGGQGTAKFDHYVTVARGIIGCALVEGVIIEDRDGWFSLAQRLR